MTLRRSAARRQRSGNEPVHGPGQLIASGLDRLRLLIRVRSSPGFAARILAWYARDSVAEVIVAVGHVRAGELAKPVDVTGERFDGRVVACAVFADVVVIRGCRHDVMVPSRS